MVWSWRRWVVIRTMRWLSCRSGGCMMMALLMFSIWYLSVLRTVPPGSYQDHAAVDETEDTEAAKDLSDAPLPDPPEKGNILLPAAKSTHKTYRSVVEAHSDNFTEQLNKVRDKFIRMRYIWNFKSQEFISSTLTRPGITGYFKTIASYQNAETISLEVPHNVLKNLLDYSHYNSTLTYVGQYYTKPNLVEFSDRLSSNAEQALQSHANFVVGDYMAYPAVTSKKKDSVVVSYLHIFSGGIVNREGDVWYYDLTVRPGGCKEKRLPTPPNTKAIATHNEVFSIVQIWGDNFYTFLAEALPRLLPYLMFLRERVTIRIHVNEATPFVMRYLAVLGIGGIRVITGNVRARVLYVPMGTPCRDPAPYTTQLMASFLQSPPNNIKKNAIVVVRRKPGQDRYLSHYGDIVRQLRAIADEFGLRVLEYKDSTLPSLPSSTKLFQQALVIVGAHGAGLANMMFTPPGSLVVEALCHNPRLIYCFSRQAAVLGHMYAGILPESHCSNTQSHDVRWVIKDFLYRILQAKPTDASLNALKKSGVLRW